MAALYKLPCIFVCENNGFGEFTSQERHQAIRDVADRAQGYGMPGIVVDGMDAMAVYEGAGEAIARARRGDGPSLVEAKTYRFFDHVGIRGMGVVYRTDDEVLEWRKRDPIALFEARLAEMGVLSTDAAAQVKERVLFEVREAIAFAEASPLPPEAGLLDDVYTAAGGAS
jgi:pyruvate dehydrogenase E1 component alpha subunit